MSYKYYYCPKCGDGVMWYKSDKCDICGHELIEAPREYKLTGADDDELWDAVHEDNEEEHEEAMRIWREREQRLFDEVISKSPIFDLDLYNRKDEIWKQKKRAYDEAQAHGSAILAGTDKGNPYGVTCPYCNATNVRKLGALSRTISLGFFGLGSGKIGKQWHCTRCGSDF